MRGRRGVVLVALLASAGVARAQPIDWSKPPALGEERTFRPPRATRAALAGGGVLLVVERRELPLVTALFAIGGAGSAADPPGREGLAGYTADLLDEGAGGLSAHELAEEIGVLGATLASWAEQDAAFVSVSALAASFPRGLELAGQVLVAPAFQPREGRRVHEDRSTAIRLRRDRPGAVADLILRRALHGEEGAYGHPVLGTARGLAATSLDEARTFHRRRYRRDRLVVVVAGDIGVDDARRLVESALAAWGPPGEDGAAAPPVKRARGPASRLLVVDRPGAEQANLVVGAAGLRRDDPRAFALDVMTNLLGGTFTSRLSRRLREQLGYTYGISADASYLKDSGEWTIDSAVFTPRTGAALKEIHAMVAALARDEVPAAELSASKRNLVRGMPLAFATNLDVADAFMGLALTGLPDDWFERYAARIEAVTSEEIRTLAASAFAARALVTVVVGPMATLRKDLSRLGLGTPLAFDADGEPRR